MEERDRPVQASCQHCRFWNREAVLTKQGECRRHPPSGQWLYQLTPDALDPDSPDESSFAVWPMTSGEDWCGEFQPGPRWRVAAKADVPGQGLQSAGD